MYPWNWSAWTLLSTCLGDGEEVCFLYNNIDSVILTFIIVQLAAILPLLSLKLSHPLVQLFQIKVLIELHSPQDTELAACDRLLGDDFFPNSLWIMSLRACVLYHLHGMSNRVWEIRRKFFQYISLLDFPSAEKQFDKILKIDPYRIDDIDIFSNILYVAENRTKLSKLAHHYLSVDKERPEVCCLVGKSITNLIIQCLPNYMAGHYS